MSNPGAPAGPDSLALIVSTLGRVAPLRTLLDSLVGQLTPSDRVVIVAQDNLEDVQQLAADFAALPITVTTSPRGASLGRNTGVHALPAGDDPLLLFPNDTTWFPEGSVALIRQHAAQITLAALTVREESGQPKFVLPQPGTALDRWNVWQVIEMGLLARRSTFEKVGGFDASIGTGAPSPWQAGEVTDFLLRAMKYGLTRDFVWLPPGIWVGGIGQSEGLDDTARRVKIRAYNRGTARLLAVWSYPLWWQLAFLAAGLLVGVRHGSSHHVADGWWAFLGRLEGLAGRTFSRSSVVQAVAK